MKKQIKKEREKEKLKIKKNKRTNKKKLKKFKEKKKEDKRGKKLKKQKNKKKTKKIGLTEKKAGNGRKGMIERSLVLLKPDAVQRQLVGRILQRFEDAGLKIAGMKMVCIDEEHASKHYEGLKGKHYFERCKKFLQEGPVIAMVLEGVKAVEVVRKITGSTYPNEAFPGTIRGDFAHHSEEHADAKGVSVKNLIHASGSIEEAKKEIVLWFKPEEMHSYKTVHEVHVF